MIAGHRRDAPPLATMRMGNTTDKARRHEHNEGARIQKQAENYTYAVGYGINLFKLLRHSFTPLATNLRGATHERRRVQE